MVELLVAMTLLSLIVFVLMAVFSSTQRAFRASVTQTDILEGGRAAMELMVTDLRGATPSDGYLNSAVNFFATNNDYVYKKYQPLIQPLPASNASRTNLLQYFFVLGRVNTTWTGTGYIVDTTSANPLYPLYRFYAVTNIANSPATLYLNFLNAVNGAQWTNMSHVMDGVVHLVVRAYDAKGYWMTNGYGNEQQANLPPNTWFSAPYPPSSTVPPAGEVAFYFYSNCVPASVELQLGVLEDRTLKRAASLAGSASAQLSYLQNQAGHVQLFRQRVTIPNVDPSAYPAYP